MTQETGWDTLYLITFSEEHQYEGFEIIFRVGTVVWTDKPGVYRVEKKCIDALKEKRLPLTQLDSNNHESAEYECKAWHITFVLC